MFSISAVIGNLLTLPADGQGPDLHKYFKICPKIIVRSVASLS